MRLQCRVVLKISFKVVLHMSFYIFCDFFYFCAQRNILYFKEQFTTVEEAILQKTLSETLLYAPVFLKIHFVRQF